MVYGYRPPTREEFEQVKQAVKEVSSQKLSCAFNHNNGIRISASKKDDYNWSLENTEKILAELENLGMFTVNIRKEFEIGRQFGYVHCQIFNQVYKAV